VRRLWCREGGQVLWVEKEKFKLEKWFAEIKKGKPFYVA
jgi:hypothetical protein